MYVLKSEQSTIPFAIIKGIENSNDTEAIHKAIKEEFMLVDHVKRLL